VNFRRAEPVDRGPAEYVLHLLAQAQRLDRRWSSVSAG
jgi:hypothetical protein